MWRCASALECSSCALTVGVCVCVWNLVVTVSHRMLPLQTELASEGVEVDAEVEVNGGEHANGSTGADTDVNMDGGTDS